MKLSRIIITTTLIVSISLAHAGDDYRIGIQSKTNYTLPKQLFTDFTETFTSGINDNVPEWIQQGSIAGEQFIEGTSKTGTALISQLTHNLTWICGGTVVGAIGAYLACKGIGRYFDPDKNKNENDTKTHLKLTALGLAIMAGTGLTVNALLK